MMKKTVFISLLAASVLAASCSDLKFGDEFLEKLPEQI